MKKLMSLVVVVLFATATFAQDTKAEKPPMTKSSDMKMKHDCYTMKDGALMHCTGDKMEAQKAPVTLKNGTVISPNGEIKMKEGKTMKLANGQCISMMGSIGDYNKMHESMSAPAKTPEKK